MLKLIFSSCSITCLPPEAICPVLLQMGSRLKITSLVLLSTNIFRLGPHLSTFKTRDIVLKIVPRIRRCGRITFKLIILLISSMQSLKSWFSAWFFLSVSTLVHYFLILLWTEYVFVISYSVPPRIPHSLLGAHIGTDLKEAGLYWVSKYFPVPSVSQPLGTPLQVYQFVVAATQVTILSLHCYCFLCPLP